MDEKKKKDKKEKCNCKDSGMANTVYGLGLIGALVYFISNATGFWSVVLGVLKSLLWPAFIVFELLKFLYA